MSLEDAQAELDAARVAVAEFDDRQTAAIAALKDEGRQVNARYQAAEAAVLAEQPKADPALAQSVEG